MATSKVEYLGGLRTKCTHLKSGTEIITDAPVDNNGKGEAFSPTDLIATSYASCMITIMGIHCANNNIQFNAAQAVINKIMGSGPRRIVKLEIEIDLSGNNWTIEERDAIIRAGEACPVAKTVDPELEIELKYTF